VQAAFGYQGQKSRVRADSSPKIYDTFVQNGGAHEKNHRRTERIQQLHGSVSASRDEKRFWITLRWKRREAAHRENARGRRLLIEPTLLWMSIPSPAAQEEVFGPVLAVIKAQNLRPGAGDCE